MKFFKYLFILVVIILIGYSVYTVYYDKNDEIVDETLVQETNESTILTDLRVAVVDMDSMNPIISTNKYVQSVTQLIYEPLFKITYDYQTEPCLATEWAKTGDTTYIVKLRQGVKWQDGSDFNAQDVKFTVDMIKNNKSIYSYNLENVIGLDIIDDYTVKFTLSEEEQFFEYNLTFPILSNNYYIDQNFLTTEKNNKPMGTGMYKISDVQSTYISLKQNQTWWNVETVDTKIKTVTINLYSSIGEVYNDFKLGKLDLISIDNLNYEDYIGTAGYETVDIKGREYDYIAMNCQANILKHVEVRKAIDYAIDKTTINANVFNSKFNISKFPLDYGSYVYDVESVTTGYNPEQSKQILIDNGWEYRNNYWQKTEDNRNLKISLNLVVNSSNGPRVKVAEEIKSQLENIGIRINIITVSDSQYQNTLNNKNYDILLTGIYSGFSPNINRYFGQNNLSNYSNEEVSSILADIKNISKPSLIKEKYGRIIEIYNEQVLCISLYYNKVTVAYSNYLKGTVSANNYSMFYNIANWYREY